jgi:cobalt-zinc-cadmium efflux system protein
VNHEAHPHEDHQESEPELFAEQQSRLYLAIALNVLVIVFQIFFGIYANSMGLIADAGHNFADVGGLVLATVAIGFMRRGRTKNKTFGYHRSGVLAAQANAALLLVSTGIIIFESVTRLAHPQDVKSSYVIVVAAIAAVVNLGSAYAIHGVRHDEHDMNSRAAVLHLVGDGAASLAVVVVGIIIAITGGAMILDPIVSLLISAYILYQGFDILRSANEVLLESMPKDLAESDIESAICAVGNVRTIHDLHVWSLSQSMRAMSAHVVLDGNPNLTDAQQTSSTIKDLLQRQFNISHATLELETET